MDLGIAGKLALVTGSSKGLGFGVAEALVAGYAQASLQSGVALVIMLGIMIWQAGRRPMTADQDTV